MPRNNRTIRVSAGLPRARFFQSDAPLFAIRDVRHMRRNGGAMAKLHRSIWRLPRANAIYPVGHMVLVRRAAGKSFAVRPVYLLGIVTRAFLRAASDHLVRAGNMLDGAIATQQPLAQPIPAVA